MSHEELIANHSHCLSRRRFIASAGILTAAACFSPGYLFAEGENILLAARKRAETTDITVQTLRGNVNALIGSGGNIAVLSGTDGKLVIVLVMQPLAPGSPTLWLKCTRARSNISSTRTGTSIIGTAMSGCFRRAP